jgi:D-lactate dehydrogenase
MRLALFSTKDHDERFFTRANEEHGHDIDYLEARLCAQTAPLAEGHEAVCPFVQDELDAEVLRILRDGGTRLVALRCAGFNNVDLDKAQELGLTVMRVPAYSPHAVAEHAVGLMLSLNRKIHRANDRVREQNFSLRGLMGFDMHGKTAGVVGAGHIGSVVCRILLGFGMRVLAHAHHEDEELARLGVEFVSMDDLLRQADIVTLHVPLTPETHHLLDAQALETMRRGAMLINTSRGKVVDTRAALDSLRDGHLGSLGLDVYEEEGDVFYRDLSDQVLDDEVLARLILTPNVIVTAHQGYFTREALQGIADTTLQNVSDFQAGAKDLDNVVHAAKHQK